MKDIQKYYKSLKWNNIKK